MPTPTFFNLPEEKRQRLMAAVWKEFSSYSYADVSINRIIQEAGISRGSFYQYFSGKQELFGHLLQTIMQTAKGLFQAQLTAHNNDLFAALLGMYDTLLWKTSRQQNSEEAEMLRKMFRLNASLDHSLLSEVLDLQSLTVDAMALLADSGYPLQTPQQCAAVIHMLLSLGLCALNTALRQPEQEPIARRLLEDQLAIIRNGIRQ